MSSKNESEDNKPDGLTKLLWLVLGVLGTLIFPLLEPTLQKLGNSFSDRVFPKPQVFISACAPLESAYRLYRAFDSNGNDIELKKESSEAINRVFIQVFNLTENALSDVEITVIPFIEREDVDDFSRIEISSNSIAGSQKYKVARGTKGEIKISIDNLPTGEGIIVDAVLYSVLDLHVEFRSKELSERKYFPKGCEERVPSVHVDKEYLVYKNQVNFCVDSKDDNSGDFTCESTIWFPKEIFTHLKDGAGIEATQYRNGEIEFISRYDPNRVPNSPIKTSDKREGLIFENFTPPDSSKK